MIGQRIGKYTIIRELGKGGMGAVYLAERNDGSFHQRTAVKLIKRGMDTEHILKRFRHERQILAALNHPNIARLLDGGTTEDHLPFFVMEYIEGVSIIRYGKENNLSVKQKLEIFRQVCDAVENAHERRIVHRDLKPSNILVRQDATPKLLDFGIAKILDANLADETIEPTATAMRMMTPEYASPEQVSGAEITIASDIYSLGVLLYEFLTEQKPYALKRRAPHEIARVVCDEEPVAPSSKNAELNSEVDRIVLKALRKDPAERYFSAADFAADITSYLENRPVSARSFPPKFKIKSAKTQTEKSSVAILPFKIFGKRETEATGENEFLGVGLADALIFRLSGTNRLIVRPTSSVLRFGEMTDSFAAGRELQVDYVVDGNIRLVGNRLRVSAQLLDVEENSTKWAQKFDEDAADVLELEDSLSEKVSASLLPHLAGDEQKNLRKRGTNSPSAYEAYLRGRYLANQFTNDALFKSVAAFEEAIELDANYALPRIGIAEFYVWSSVFGVFPAHEAYAKAKQELNKALAIDDSLAEAYALGSLVALLYDWDWAKAERLVGKSLEIDPNFSFAHNAHAHILASRGDADQAMHEIRLAESLDPFSPFAKVSTACISYQARYFDESAAKARQASEMQMNFPQGFLHLGNSLTHTGGTSKAVEVLTMLASVWENSALPKYMLCFAHAEHKQIDEARKVLQQSLELAGKEFVKPFFIAMAYAAVGEIDESFKWFAKSVEMRDEWLIWFGTDIKLDFLRNDPRYFEILKQTNNPIIFRQQRKPENKLQLV